MEQNSSSIKKHYSYALRCLAKRDYTQTVLKKKLLAKGASLQDAQTIIKKLTDLCLIDDKKYAETRMRMYLKKGYASKMIQYKLQQEGLEFSSDNFPLYNREVDFSEEESIRMLLNKKKRILDKYYHAKDYKEKERLKNQLLRYLYSKGHNGALAIEIINKISLEIKNDYEEGSEYDYE